MTVSSENLNKSTTRSDRTFQLTPAARILARRGHEREVNLGCDKYSFLSRFSSTSSSRSHLSGEFHSLSVDKKVDKKIPTLYRAGLRSCDLSPLCSSTRQLETHRCHGFESPISHTSAWRANETIAMSGQSANAANCKNNQ